MQASTSRVAVVKSRLPARAALLAQISRQGFVVDLGSKERHHPVNNPQLKADQGKEALARREEELNDRLGSDLSDLFSLLSNWDHGKEKELRV